MSQEDYEIFDYEVPDLTESLINFLGKESVNHSLEQYKHSKLTVGKIYHEYYLKNKHPWWESLLLYKKLKDNNQLHLKNFNTRLMRLAEDSKKIQILKKYMPESIIAKYKRDFVDNENAINYLFELDTAWHFHRKGFDIHWLKDTGSKKSEFQLSLEGKELEVECKRIGVDAFRKIRRPDFYRLCDYILPNLQTLKLTGEIKLVLVDNLPKNDDKLRSISSQILNIIQNNNFNGKFEFEEYSVILRLNPVSGILLNANAYMNDFYKSIDHSAHGVLFFQGSKNHRCDPVSFIIKSQKSDDLLIGIQKKIKNAIKGQLSGDKSGFVSIFIPEITDFAGLEKNSGIMKIAHNIFSDRNYDHVVSISFVSDSRYTTTISGRVSDSPALFFNNANCRFDEFKDFEFGINKIA